MAVRFVSLFAALTVVQAGLIQSPIGLNVAPSISLGVVPKIASPISIASPIAKTLIQDSYDPNPQYSFEYGVQDSLTGDSKKQVESRSGDVVKGSYSLVDPDGTLRTVHYTADPINGFNALVSRQRLGAKIAAPITLSAPVTRIATPIATPLAIAAPKLSRAISTSSISLGAPLPRIAAAPLALSGPIGLTTTSKLAAPIALVGPSAISSASITKISNPISIARIAATQPWGTLATGPGLTRIDAAPLALNAPIASISAPWPISSGYSVPWGLGAKTILG
ncbi:Ccp84Ab [Carabus blaptoides fortunei]